MLAIRLCLNWNWNCELGWRRSKRARSSLFQVIWPQPATIALTGKCYNPNRAETGSDNPIFAGGGHGPGPATANARRTADRAFAGRQAAGQGELPERLYAGK